jgi:DUF4097 and DUF4098 domain-containing protein YvlB
VRDLGALSLRTISGEISVKFKSTSGAGKEEKHAYSLDSLKVSIVNGDVEMNNLVVVKKTHVEIVNGQVSADLTTAGLVKVDMVNGGIGLNINSAAPHPQASLVLGSGSVGGNGWSPENLDVEANAVNGPISVTFVSPFCFLCLCCLCLCGKKHNSDIKKLSSNSSIPFHCCVY